MTPKAWSDLDLLRLCHWRGSVKIPILNTHTLSSFLLTSIGVHSVSKHRMRLKNNQDLWLEFLLLNGSPLTAYWLALWKFHRNKRKALVSPNNRTEPIACCASDCCRKHPSDNVCDKQKSKPLLSDDLPGSVCVCKAVWMNINWRTQRLSLGTFTNNVLSIWPVRHSSSQRRGLS